MENNQTKNIVKKILNINKELALRENDKLKNYNKDKVHYKQIAFHKNKSKIRWVFGGNRSGKTECGAVETVWLALGKHPYRDCNKATQGWVVSLSTQVQRDVAQQKVLSYLPKRSIVEIVMLNGSKSSPQSGIIDFILVKHSSGQLSKIGFKSCDQGREKFQGTSLDYVWFDEEPPEDIFDECLMRIMDKSGIMFGTMTPLKGLSWVYTKIYLKANVEQDIWCEHMEWGDNPYLPKDEVIKMTQGLSSEELQSRRYGKFLMDKGAVYSEFDPSIHVIEPFNVPKEWYSNISIDPGLNNPLSAHWYCVSNDNVIYVIKEHFQSNKDIEYHSRAIIDICKSLDWHVGVSGMYEALIDSAANQRTLASPKSVSQLFYENGIAVNPKVNKDLWTGIARIKALLKPADNSKPKLYIFNNCPNMISEFKTYWWGNGDNPIKKDDHALDELRYFVMSMPKAPITQQEFGMIQKHKANLIRRNAKNRWGTN